MDPRREVPASIEEAAAVLRSAGARDRRRLHIRGGGTKEWGNPGEPPDIEVSTGRLDGVLEHNEGDLTAVFQGGVRLVRAKEALAEARQMVALDPPLGEGDRATIGGVVATGDTGPLRHRYGAPRDLILGITVVLSDGTVARAGGKVIKNVAGYDLAKLFTGSFGTLGLIAEVVMRLHPRSHQMLTAVGRSDDAGALGRAAAAVAHSPYGPECLDVAWSPDGGELLARFAGAAPEAGAGAVVKLMDEAGLETGVIEDDEPIWDRQRARQRSPDGAVVKVSGLLADLATVLQAAHDVGGSLVGRAGMGLAWITLAGDASDLVSMVEDVRRRLHPFPCVVLDAPPHVREKIDVWGDDGALPLMQRVKARFDPAGVCNPGVFVGGI